MLKKNRNQRGSGKEQGMPGSKGMREMSGVICGPRGVGAGSSAGFNLDKWPRQRNQLKSRESGEHGGRRRIKLQGSGVCFANSPAKLLPYQLKGLKTSEVGGSDSKEGAGAGAGELWGMTGNPGSWRSSGTWDNTGESREQTPGMWGGVPESLSQSFALSGVSWRGRIAGKNPTKYRDSNSPSELLLSLECIYSRGELRLHFRNQKMRNIFNIYRTMCNLRRWQQWL